LFSNKFEKFSFRSDDWKGNGSSSRATSAFDSGTSGFEGFDRKPSGGSNLWEKEFEVMKSTNVKPKSDWGNTFDDMSASNNNT
jgi:hypothetical protein